MNERSYSKFLRDEFYIYCNGLSDLARFLLFLFLIFTGFFGYYSIASFIIARNAALTF